MDSSAKNGETNAGKAGATGTRQPVDYPAEEDILASAPEGWTNYIRQLGTDFIAQVSIYNEVLNYLDALTVEGAMFELTSNKIGPNRIDWLPDPRLLLLENTALGVCWMYWIGGDWEPMVSAGQDSPRHRTLQLADVRACVKIMSPAAYAEHVAWEMARAKH
jgi:hypothetical protein